MLRFLNAEGVKVVARGAGTSLAGGALPAADAVVLGVSKMNRILDIDTANRTIRVEAGVTNLGVSGRGQSSRLLLCARSVEPACLHDRREHRDEFGRGALPQIRRDDQQCARREDGA